MYGIKINVTSGEKIEKGASKFFGDPLLPQKWLDDDIFQKNEMFFCQIKLEDIVKFDDEDILPHDGYLYFFLDVSKYPYKPIVRYFNGKPEHFCEGFNDGVDADCDVSKAFTMIFSKSLESNLYYSDEFAEDGTRLLGVCDELGEYEIGENDIALFTYDCKMSGGIEFLNSIDGKLCITIDRYKLKSKDFSNVSLFILRN